MKLLFIINEPGFFLSHRLPVALAARDAGYDIFVVTPSGTAVDEIRRANLTHIPWPLSRGGMHPLQELKSIWTLAHVFRRLRPDLVHLVSIKPVLYGGILARLMRVPTMVAAVTGMGYLFVGDSTQKGTTRRLAEIAYRFAFKHVHSRVIVQNHDDEAALRSMGALRSDQSVLVKGSGVDLECFTPTPLPHTVPIVVLPARMLWHKGVGEFVEAAKLLSSNDVSVRMVLVGPCDPDNPKSVSLHQLQQWQNQKTVEWWGHQADMPAVLSAAHLVVLPSYYREGMPKSLLEAAAAGRAIITTNSVGCREAVDHGKNGLLIPPRDAVALADAIQILLADQKRLEAMGRQGRLKAESEFGIEGIVQQHMEIYQTLCPI